MPAVAAGRRQGERYRRGDSRIYAGNQLAETGPALLLVLQVQRLAPRSSMECEPELLGLDERVEVGEQKPQLTPGRAVAESFAKLLHAKEGEKLRADAADGPGRGCDERGGGFANGSIKGGLLFLRASETAGTGTPSPGLLPPKQDLLQAVPAAPRRDVLRDGVSIGSVTDRGAGWRWELNPRVVEFSEEPGFEAVAAPERRLVFDEQCLEGTEQVRDGFLFRLAFGRMRQRAHG